jgi:hypothetical protein
LCDYQVARYRKSVKDLRQNLGDETWKDGLLRYRYQAVEDARLGLWDRGKRVWRYHISD